MWETGKSKISAVVRILITKKERKSKKKMCGGQQGLNDTERKPRM